MAVVDPIILIEGRAQVVVLIIGNLRINRNTPATTIVELCRRAETGVGPSMAEGSQGEAKIGQTYLQQRRLGLERQASKLKRK